jgi:hypothetical protein
MQAFLPPHLKKVCNAVIHSQLFLHDWLSCATNFGQKQRFRHPRQRQESLPSYETLLIWYARTLNTLYPASSRDIIEPGKHINHSPKSPSAQTQKTARISGNYCAQKILKLRAEIVKSNLLFTLNARSNFHRQARLNAKMWKLSPFLWKQANTFHFL